MINHEGCPACSLLAEWPAVWFHGLDFPSGEQQPRLTTLGRWGWRRNRKVVAQSIGGTATFYDFDLGRTLHRLYSDAGWAKKQEWNGPGVQHNREVKWRVQQRWWWWLGFFWLKWLLQAASLIKLWILWSDQLNKLHLPAVGFRLVQLIVVMCPALFPLFLAQKAGTDRGLPLSVFLLIRTNPAPSVKVNSTDKYRVS